MATWQNAAIATLKVRKANSSTDSFLFPGVASAASAGTPDQFLAAANHILDIGGKLGVLTGMQRTVTQGVSN